MAHTSNHYQRQVSENLDTPRSRSTDGKFFSKSQGNLNSRCELPGREPPQIPARQGGRTTDSDEVTYKNRVNNKIPVSKEIMAKVTRPALFTTNKRDYSVAEFYHKFHHLPKVVMVTQSFRGNVFCQQIFNENDILLLNTVASQTRLMAQCGHSREQRMISLPGRFSGKLVVERGHRLYGQEMTLSEILKRHTLPISVLFPDNLCLERSDGTTIISASQQMRLLYTFGEINLLANVINFDLSGGVELGPITPIPLFLPNLRLAVVTGIAGKPLCSCDSFNEQVRLRSFEYEYDTVYGSMDITEYAPETVNSRIPLSCLSPTAVCVVISRPKMMVKDQTVQHTQRLTDDIHYRQSTSSNDRLCSEQASDEQRPPLPRRSANAKGPVKGSVSVNERSDLPRPQTQQKIVGFKSHTEAECSNVCPQTESSRGLKIMHSKTGNLATVTSHHSSEQGLVPAAVFDTTTKGDKKSEPPSLKTKSDYLTPMFSADDVARLSISEVGKFLQKLNLGKYVREFGQHRVDGKLLVALDKEVFQEDFGMTGVEALRLYKFAKDGHVPK